VNQSDTRCLREATSFVDSAQPAIEIIRLLNQCERRKISKTSAEERAKRIADWLLLSSFILIGSSAIFVWLYDVRPAPEHIKNLVLFACTLAMGLAVASLIVPILLSMWLLWRWKGISFESLCSDISHEYAQASKLMEFGMAELSDAQFWLQRKIQRITARTARLFGEKTAAVGLIAAAYSFADEFGGFNWIATTLAKGMAIENLGNTILLLIGAALAGISIGTILLEHVASRYRYQLELLELVLRYKADRAFVEVGEPAHHSSEATANV
jgi:hypothetical protein